jgi:hypothetical protein
MSDHLKQIPKGDLPFHRDSDALYVKMQQDLDSNRQLIYYVVVALLFVVASMVVGLLIAI